MELGGGDWMWFGRQGDDGNDLVLIESDIQQQSIAFYIL
jgi:hypothetical protein